MHFNFIELSRVSYRQDGIFHTYPSGALHLDRDSDRMVALVDYTYVQLVAARDKHSITLVD